MGRLPILSALLLLAAVPVMLSGRFSERDSVTPAAFCVDCHTEVSPGIVSDWRLSKHSGGGVDCAVCHGGQHASAEDVDKVVIPT
ncbi:MAG: cytochrome C, partial [Gemmatimonadota bacterium]